MSETSSYKKDDGDRIKWLKKLHAEWKAKQEPDDFMIPDDDFDEEFDAVGLM